MPAIFFEFEAICDLTFSKSWFAAYLYFNTSVSFGSFEEAFVLEAGGGTGVRESLENEGGGNESVAFV
jgi:hypothetical protein